MLWIPPRSRFCNLKIVTCTEKLSPMREQLVNLNTGEISISIPLHGLIKMWTTLLFIPFILTGFVAIGYANVTADNRWAGINGFTLWNCLPILLAAITLIPAATRSRSVSYGESPHAHRRLRDLWARIGLAGAMSGVFAAIKSSN